MKILRFPLGSYGANCSIVYDAHCRAVVIDPGEDASVILKHVAQLSLNVEAVLLTHGHFDHVGAVAAVQRQTGAKVYVHTDDERALHDPTYSVMPIAEPFTADVLVQDGDVLRFGELTFTVLHTPGHTPGSVCYVCDDVVFVGDTLFAGGIGRTDFPGGDMAAMQRSLHRLQTLPDTLRVICGHGTDTTVGYEKQTNPFMIGL